MPKWTEDQSLAINERGGKVIVSAAAGSGKTAVLSERVIKYVMSGGNINDLLIVTFTKAAAFEMKTRIKEKIKEAYLEDLSNSHLKTQLLLVETAKITTMDAFYQELVKNNFEKLGIDRNFKILSSEEENIIKEEILKNVLERAFDEVFDYEKLLDAFGSNDPDLIKDVIFKVSSFIQTLPFKDEFINHAVNNYDQSSILYKNLLLDQIKEKMKLYKSLYDEVKEEFYDESDDFDKLLETLEKERNYINDFLKIDSFDTLASRIRSISFDTLRTPKGHKDNPKMVKYKYVRDDLKKEIKDNISEFAFISDKSFEKEQAYFKSVVTKLFEVVNLYLDELFREKKKRNSFTFSDIAFFVIDLLIKDGKKTHLAEEISKKYKEILIDEYQDTNNLQNVIFNAISDDNKNLFIVGDVKQSIYRFRSACPEIFNNDKNNASFDSFPKLITLSKNFRSRAEVLNFCNFIFENTMTNLFGEVNYDDKERLYLGALFEEGDDLETEIHLIDGREKIELEDDKEELSRAQKEAVYVADRIKALITNKHQVYDNKKKLWRDIKESDIVILLRSLKNSELYVKALNKRGLSVYSSSSTVYFDNYEIKLIINLLKVIDNPRDDISLMSVLKSSLIGVSLDEIVSIRNKGSFLIDNISVSNNERLKEIVSNINDLRSYSHNHTVYDLLSKIYNTYDVLSILRAMKGGLQREKNLIQMLNHAVSFEKDESKSLHEFISYIESVTLNKDSLEGVNPLSEGDNVLITTIHKSKGLEYPIVFVCEIGKNFNFADIRSEVMINEELGICFPNRKEKYKVKYESVPMLLFKEQEKSKMLSEELRVLYVALTRAKEKLIITGFTSNLERMVEKASAKMGIGDTISNLYLKSSKNYLDIMLPCLLRHPALKELRDISPVSVKIFASDAKIKLNVINAVKISEEEFNEEEIILKNNYDVSMLNRLKEFSYDYSLCYVPESLSVSALKEEESIFTRPNFMTDGVNYAKTGTLYHKIFEYLPVEKYDVKLLKKALDDMVLSGKITSEERKIINLEKIFAYLTSDLYDILLTADAVFKEHELVFKAPASYYDKTINTGTILTNGTCDLLFNIGDTYYIVDYKTDKVDALEELKRRYKVQLDLYEIGVKELMNAKVVNKYIYSIKLNKFIKV